MATDREAKPVHLLLCDSSKERKPFDGQGGALDSNLCSGQTQGGAARLLNSVGKQELTRGEV